MLFSKKGVDLVLTQPKERKRVSQQMRLICAQNISSSFNNDDVVFHVMEGCGPKSSLNLHK